jgi:DNA-binding NarL/FixJ family response regulator
VPSKKTLDIMVVEDSDSDFNSVVEMFNRLSVDMPPDFSIRRETNIDKAILSKPPDVVIVDIGIPDNAVDTILPRITTRFPNSAVVALTKMDNPDMHTEAFMLGAQDFIDMDELNKVSLWKSINYAINRKRMEISMRIDRENLDKANSILKITSDISKDILDGQFVVEDMMAAIGTGLGIDGMAVFCDKCLCDGKPHCYWTGGRMPVSRYLSRDCHGEAILSNDVAGFITYNLPVFTKIRDLPDPIRDIVSTVGFGDTSKVVVVPIMMDHEPWGIFCFYTLNGKTWSVAEMDALATLSRLAGSIIRNQQMEDEITVEVQEKFSVLNRMMEGYGE